jgi:hypothetical protein
LCNVIGKWFKGLETERGTMMTIKRPLMGRSRAELEMIIEARKRERRVEGMLIGLVILLLTILGIIGTLSSGHTPIMPITWSHITDTPAVKMENREQYFCVTDGTIQDNEGALWCTNSTVEME